VQRLKVELIGGLNGNELHCRPLHRFGNRLGIVEVVLLPLGIGPHILCRHQSGIVPERGELAAEMMCPDASLHADQTGWEVGEPRLDLTSRPLLANDDRAAAIMADHVERVLADVDADYGDLGACCLGHGRAPVDAAPAQRGSLAGQEHGRTIPLPGSQRVERVPRVGRYSANFPIGGAPQTPMMANSFLMRRHCAQCRNVPCRNRGTGTHGVRSVT
jgi:hypothetical protein